MDDCIFCKIAKGDIPCAKIIENDQFFAFLDNRPFTEGHALVIPKGHFRWVHDVPNFGEYWEFARQVTQKIQANLSPVFVSYLTMGNEVPHAHIHILPRYENDVLVGLYKEEFRTPTSANDLKKLADKINL